MEFRQCVANGDVRSTGRNVYKPTAVTIPIPIVKNSEDATSHLSLPDAIPNTAADWEKPAGLSSEPWPGCINSEDSAHATIDETISKRHSWPSAAH